jgi:hypothetical protein
MTRVIHASKYACSEGDRNVTLNSVFACKPAVALAAVLTVGSLPFATDASAHYGRGYHYGGYHYGGYHYGGFRHGGYWRGGYRPYAHHYYYRGFRAYPRSYYYGYSCHRWRWVATPWGWRWRSVNMCYPHYRSYYNYY